MSLLGTLQAASFLVIAASLLATLNPTQHFLELFTHFRLQYFLASIVFALTFAALQHYGFAVTMLAAAFLNGFFIVPWYLSHHSADAGDSTLKVMHANVLSKNNEYQRLLDLIEAEVPDVIFLQEVTGDWVSGLQELEERYPYSVKEARSGNFGIAMYSRVEFETARSLNSPPLNHPTIVATLRVNGDLLTLMSTHPTIPLGASLSAARNTQIADLTQLVASSDGRVVVLGDFNATMWDPHLKSMLHDTGLSNAREGFGIVATWPTYLPIAMIPIDHILIPDGISVAALKTGKRIGSDHLPLIATLTW